MNKEVAMKNNIQTIRIKTDWDGLFRRFERYSQVSVFHSLVRSLFDKIESETSNNLVWAYNKKSLNKVSKNSGLSVDYLIQTLSELVELAILTKTEDGNYLLPSEYIEIEFIYKEEYNSAIEANEAHNRSKAEDIIKLKE